MLYIRAALRSEQTRGEVFWKGWGEKNASHRVPFEMIGDGQLRTYAVRLSDSPAYRGVITGLRFDPVPSGKEGEWIKIQSISFTSPVEGGHGLR